MCWHHSSLHMAVSLCACPSLCPDFSFFLRTRGEEPGLFQYNLILISYLCRVATSQATSERHWQLRLPCMSFAETQLKPEHCCVLLTLCEASHLPCCRECLRPLPCLFPVPGTSPHPSCPQGSCMPPSQVCLQTYLFQ